MTDDIVTRLREILADPKPIFTQEVLSEAADEIERLRENYKLAYWNLRQVLTVARDTLESPHPLWGYLNECFEDIDRMEITLDIVNRMDD